MGTTTVASEPRAAAPATRRPWWLPAPVYVALSFVLALVATLGSSNPLDGLPGPEGETGVPFWDAWFRYDAGWYAAIAQDGYTYTEGQQSSIAFFPTYPLSMRALAEVVDNLALAGVLITLASGLGAVLLFRWWVARVLPPRSAWVAVALLLLYPYSLYLYGAVYADALFLLTALGAFVLLERGHPWLAGLVGALATAGRPVGLAVAAGLVVRAVELAAARRAAGRVALPPEATTSDPPGDDRTSGPLGTLRTRALEVVTAVRAVRFRDAGVLLSLLGLVGFSTYQALAFGEPLAFVETQGSPGWDQGSGPRTWFKVVFVGTMVFGPWDVAVKLFIPALFVAIGLLLVWRIKRTFGWGYATYAFLMVAVPAISTKDFMGTGRYLLAAFPVIAVAGDLLAEQRRRWVMPLVLGLMALGLVVGTYLYGTAYQVS